MSLSLDEKMFDDDEHLSDEHSLSSPNYVVTKPQSQLQSQSQSHSHSHSHPQLQTQSQLHFQPPSPSSSSSSSSLDSVDVDVDTLSLSQSLSLSSPLPLSSRLSYINDYLFSHSITSKPITLSSSPDTPLSSSSFSYSSSSPSPSPSPSSSPSSSPLPASFLPLSTLSASHLLSCFESLVSSHVSLRSQLTETAAKQEETARQMRRQEDRIREAREREREMDKKLAEEEMKRRAVEKELSSTERLLKGELAALEKKCVMIQRRDNQYRHDLRKRELDIIKLTDRLSKLAPSSCVSSRPSSSSSSSSSSNDVTTTTISSRGAPVVEHTAPVRSRAKWPSTKSPDLELAELSVFNLSSRVSSLVSENESIRGSLRTLDAKLTDALKLKTTMVSERRVGERNDEDAEEEERLEELLSPRLRSALSCYTPSLIDMPVTASSSSFAEEGTSVVEEALLAKIKLLKDALQREAELNAVDKSKDDLIERLKRKIATQNLLLSSQDSLIQSRVFSTVATPSLDDSLTSSEFSSSPSSSSSSSASPSSSSLLSSRLALYSLLASSSGVRLRALCEAERRVTEACERALVVIDANMNTNVNTSASASGNGNKNVSASASASASASMDQLRVVREEMLRVIEAMKVEPDVDANTNRMSLSLSTPGCSPLPTPPPHHHRHHQQHQQQQQLQPHQQQHHRLHSTTNINSLVTPPSRAHAHQQVTLTTLTATAAAAPMSTIKTPNFDEADDHVDDRHRHHNHDRDNDEDNDNDDDARSKLRGEAELMVGAKSANTFSDSSKTSLSPLEKENTKPLHISH